MLEVLLKILIISAYIVLRAVASTPGGIPDLVKAISSSVKAASTSTKAASTAGSGNYNINTWYSQPPAGTTYPNNQPSNPATKFSTGAVDPNAYVPGTTKFGPYGQANQPGTLSPLPGSQTMKGYKSPQPPVPLKAPKKSSAANAAFGRTTTEPRIPSTGVSYGRR